MWSKSIEGVRIRFTVGTSVGFGGHCNNPARIAKDEKRNYKGRLLIVREESLEAIPL